MKKLSFLILTLLAFLNVRSQEITHTLQGATVKILTHYTGEKIKLNDVVTFQVIQKTSNDSILFSTYAAGHPVKIQVQPTQNIGDLMEVLPLLTVHDSAWIQIPSDSVFKGHEEQRPPFLSKGSNLIFLLKIEKIQSLNEAIAEKNAALESMKTVETIAANRYIADHKLLVKTTPSGLKYIITHPSLKPKPLKGDTVLVNYAGSNLDGKVFDTSIKSVASAAHLEQPGRTYEPYQVILGTSPVIKGWDEGLLLLNEGDKAKFIIPSDLGYGSQGAGNDIAPYSTLIFDVELVKIKPIKHSISKVATNKRIIKKHSSIKKKK